MLSTQEQILQTIKKSNKILITYKSRPKVDTIASAIALFNILKQLKKDVTIISEKHTIPERLKFLPDIDNIKLQNNCINKFTISLDISKTKINEFSYEIEDDKLNIFVTPKQGSFKKEDVSIIGDNFNYDLIIVVDTSDIDYLGSIYEKHTEAFYKTPIINLDHLAENEGYGQINHVDLTSTATSEIIYDLFFPKNNNLLNESIATYLLTGIISETKCFKTPQVNPKTLNIVSELVASGANRDQIVQNLYRTKSLATLKTWGKILLNLQYDEKTKHVWSVIPCTELEQTAPTEESLVEMIEDLITNAPEAQIISLVYENKQKQIQSIVYTEKSLNALKLTQNFNPKGTKHLCFFTIEGLNLEQAKSKLISEVEEKLTQIPDNNR